MMVNSEEIHYFFHLVERVEFNRCCCCELDWIGKGVYFVGYSLFPSVWKLTLAPALKLSICLKYLVTGIRFLLLFSDENIRVSP